MLEGEGTPKILLVDLDGIISIKEDKGGLQLREKLLSEQEIGALADGRILTSSEALRAKLIDQIAYLDETVEVMKKTLTIDKARVITYARPGDYKSNIYSGMPLPGPHIINLISINAEDLPPFSGVQFMYLWNP